MWYTHNTVEMGTSRAGMRCVWEELKTLESSKWSLYLGGSHLAVLNGEEGGGGRGRGEGEVLSLKTGSKT